MTLIEMRPIKNNFIENLKHFKSLNSKLLSCRHKLKTRIHFHLKNGLLYLSALDNCTVTLNSNLLEQMWDQLYNISEASFHVRVIIIIILETTNCRNYRVER